MAAGCVNPRWVREGKNSVNQVHENSCRNENIRFQVNLGKERGEMAGHP